MRRYVHIYQSLSIRSGKQDFYFLFGRWFLDRKCCLEDVKKQDTCNNVKTSIDLVMYKRIKMVSIIIYDIVFV